jgi:hypothetical protein
VTQTLVTDALVVRAPINTQVVLLVVATVSGTTRCGAERFRSLDLVLNNTRAGQV